MLNLIHEVVEAGIEPFAGYWHAGPEEPIPVFETNRINIVVTGGETNGHFSIFQGSPMRGEVPGRPRVERDGLDRRLALTAATAMLRDGA